MSPRGRLEPTPPSRIRLAERIIFPALCLTLFLLPLPYGSVEEWSIFAFEALTLVLFAIHVIDRIPGTKPLIVADGDSERDDSGQVAPSKPPKSFSLPSGLLAIFFGLTLLQIVPLPDRIVKVVSPQAYDIAMKGHALLGDPLPRFLTLSLAPALTSYEIVKWIGFFLFSFLVYRYSRTRRQVEALVWVMLAAGLFQAIYGLTELWGGTGRIFGWKNIYNPGSAFGTYVNRDHFSGFLEMVFPLALGALLAKAALSSMRPGLTVKEKCLWFFEERLQKMLLLGLVPVILGLGIVFSRCRSGVFILLVSLVLMSLVVSSSGARGRRASSPPIAQPARSSSGLASAGRLSAKLIRTVAIAVAALTLAVGLDPIVSRFTKENLAEDANRAVRYRNTLDLARLFFLSGSGAGTFLHAYPLVEKTDYPGLIVHAHNDYLETLAESGVPAGGALIFAAFLVLHLIFRRWSRRRDAFVRGIALGAMAGILALMIHGLFDFNLRTPANAAYFCVLFALAFRTVRLPSRV